MVKGKRKKTNLTTKDTKDHEKKGKKQEKDLGPATLHVGQVYE